MGCGVLFGLGIYGLSVMRLAGIRRRSEVLPPDSVLGITLERTLDRAAFGRSVALYLSGEVKVPLVTGILHPAIILPEGTREWPESQIQAVFLHELAHVARNDLASALFSRAVLTVHWFNPLLWLSFRNLQDEAEQAADDEAAHHQGTSADYAANLVAIVRKLKAAQANPLSAIGMRNMASLDGRIRRLLNATRKHGTPSPWKCASAILSTAALALSIGVVRPVVASPVPDPKLVEAVPSPTDPQKQIPAHPANPWEGYSPFVTQLPAVAGGFSLNATKSLSWAGKPAFPVKLRITQDRKVIFEKDGIVSSPVTINCTLKPGEYMMQSVAPEDSGYWSAYGARFTIAEDGKARVQPQAMEHMQKMRPTSPKHLQVVAEKRPVLQWEPIEGAGYYTVYWLEEDADTRKVIAQDSSGKINDTKWAFGLDVNPGRIYEWTVSAYNGAGKRFAYSGSYFKTEGSAEKNTPSGGDLKITKVTMKSESDGSVVLGIDIGTISKDPIEMTQVVKVMVYPYMQTADGEVILFEGRAVPRWTTPPVDWQGGSPEHMDITISAPKEAADKFFGYYVSVSYKGRLQDIRSDPPSLVKDFSLPGIAP